MTRPFVLLDDARPGGQAWLYAEPAEIIETSDPAEVRACLERLRGRHAAGFLSYEAGHALEPRLAPLAPGAGPERAALALVRSVRASRGGRSARLPARSRRRLGRAGAAARHRDELSPGAGAGARAYRGGRHLSGQSHLPGRGPHRRPSARALRRAARAQPRRPWRDRLHRHALDPQPFARTFLHPRRRPRHRPGR